MSRAFALSVVLWGAVCLLPWAFADDSPKAKKAQPTLEDSLRRGALRAKAASDFGVVRTTTDRQLVMVVEYENGDLGLFQGDTDEKLDQFVLVDATSLDPLTDAVMRARGRPH